MPGSRARETTVIVLLIRGHRLSNCHLLLKDKGKGIKDKKGKLCSWLVIVYEKIRDRDGETTAFVTLARTKPVRPRS